MALSTPRTLLGLLAASAPASAFFLIPCWPVTTQRLDPIVSPGELSSHLHQVVGGGGFAPAMNYSDTQAADCTTCFVNKDKSNYWIPAMYYQNADGSFERVDQVGSASVYYFNEKSRLGAGEVLEPFPEGLRMLAGDPTRRKDDSSDPAVQALNYKCLNYQGTPTDHRGFPQVNCPNGVRAEVTFPSCWDGKNLDSADHKSHMAYPTGNFENGKCPDTHPHHVITLKVEFIFDTNSYKDRWHGSGQPFVWSDGDPTGFGLHADFLMGWDSTVLNAAVEQCLDPNGLLANCPPFAGLLPAPDDVWMNPGTCKIQEFVDEDVGGVLATLPGCNPLNDGSSPIVKQACQTAAKLLGDWSWASKKVSDAVSDLVGAPGKFFDKDGGSSSSSSSALEIVAIPSTTLITTTPAPPPPPPSTTVVPTTTPHVVMVTDIVFVTYTETVQATATAWANAKRDEQHQKHAHQHVHRHARRGHNGHF